MQTYRVEPPVLTLRGRVRHALMGSAAFVVVFAVVLRVADRKWPGAPVLGMAGAADFLVTVFWKRQSVEYDLEIDEGEGLRLVRDGAVRAKVRKDRVRYVREWGHGPFRRLVVSEHGPVFTRWLWGGIGVPAHLPQYESIRSLTLGWLKDS